MGAKGEESQQGEVGEPVAVSENREHMSDVCSRADGWDKKSQDPESKKVSATNASEGGSHTLAKRLLGGPVLERLREPRLFPHLDGHFPHWPKPILP